MNRTTAAEDEPWAYVAQRDPNELERLRHLEAVVEDYLAEHSRGVRGAGGVSCECHHCAVFTAALRGSRE